MLFLRTNKKYLKSNDLNIMKKKLLFLLVIILGIYIISLFFIKSQVKKELQKHPNLNYQEISIDFLGEIEIYGASYNAKTFTFNKAHIDLNLDYLSFLNGKQKIINSVNLSHTKIEIFDQKSDSIKPSDTSTVDLFIKILQFQNINLKVHHSEKILEVERLNFKIKDIENFANFNINQIESTDFKGLTYPINALQKIQLGTFTFKNKTGKLNQLRIIPLLDKDNYSKAIRRETDLIDLSIPSLDFIIDDYSLNDGDIETLIFKKVNLDSATLKIYRDKTLPDDKSIKISYAQQLKKLNYKFALHHFAINNAKIIYGEKYNEGQDYAEIKFDDVEIELDSLSNFNSNFARLKSKFRLNSGSALKLFMTYDLNADQSTFDTKIEGRNIDAKTFSDMLKNTEKKGIEGKIKHLLTEFKSKNNSASGDFKIEASDIKITIFDDQFKEKKIMTFLANKVIGDSMHESFEIEDIQKDPTKSLWNYLWSYIRFGLKTALLK